MYNIDYTPYKLSEWVKREKIDYIIWLFKR